MMSNSKFNVGDKIKCIESAFDLLTAGKVYEVIATSSVCDSAFVKVRNDVGNVSDYFQTRFELAQPLLPDLREFTLAQLRDLQFAVALAMQHAFDNAKTRRALNVTRGEFEDLKAAVDARK
jgi:hypothetical protein